MGVLEGLVHPEAEGTNGEHLGVKMGGTGVKGWRVTMVGGDDDDVRWRRSMAMAATMVRTTVMVIVMMMVTMTVMTTVMTMVMTMGRS